MASKRQTKLAIRYSRALLGAFLRSGSAVSSEQKDQLNNAASTLIKVGEALGRDKEIVTFFQNPTISLDLKEKVLSNVISAFETQDLVAPFISTVLKNGRIGILAEIADSFMNAVRVATSVVAVKVTTARNLSDEEKGSISKMISEKRSGELEFEWFVNPEILGGIILEFEGKKYDSSITGKLSVIQEQIKDI